MSKTKLQQRLKLVLVFLTFGGFSLVAYGWLTNGHDHSSHSHFAADGVSTNAINPAQIPLGDGKVSQIPQVGYVYSCSLAFGGGGSMVDGPWIQGTTWNSTTKVAVSGSVSWPNAISQITTQGSNRIISSNNLPNHTTGTFPIAPNDPAFQYDRNPNRILSQSVAMTMSVSPAEATGATCLGLGNIGVAKNGIPIYNALDELGRDAVAHEIQDSCAGHPQQQGSYHYHSFSSCLTGWNDGTTLIGYIRDGFGLFGMIENNQEITNQDLDECHGHKHNITWDGQTVNMYHYHVTREYPYTVSCYKGNVCINRLVNATSDDGTGNSCGTLSFNLARTTSNGITQTLSLVPMGGARSITFTGPPASLTLKPNVQLDGSGGTCANPIVINGGGFSQAGFVLQGKNLLKNVTITNFGTVGLTVLPPSTGKNTFDCVKVSH